VIAGEEFVEPFGVDVALEKIGLAEQAAEEADVGFDSRDGGLFEGAAEAGDGFFAAVAPGDEFGEERIVVVGDSPAVVDAVVEADARAGRNLARENFSGGWEEIVVGIFGVETNFHGVAARGDGFPCEWEAMACGDGDLEFDEVEASDLFGDGMLNLQAGIYFQEIEIEIGVNEELDGACVGVAASAGEPDRGFAHFFAEVGRHDRRRGFFDDFLVAALDGAFAFAEGDHAAVLVGENLDFDVMGLFQIFFEVEARITERVHRLGACVAVGGCELGAAVDETHAFATAAGDGLEKDREAHRTRQRVSLFGFFDRIVGAGDGGNVGAAGNLASGGFCAESFHGLRGGANEGDACVRAGARECGVFGEEAVAGMDGVGAGFAGDADDFVNVEIAFAGRGGADGISLVGEADVERFAVDFAEDGDGTDAEFAAGAKDADCNFSPVGNQDFFEHEGVLVRRGF